MFKIILVIIKKALMSVLFLYAYNKLTLPLNIIIPMNLYTISLVTICGIPAILMLVLFSLVCI